MFSPGWAIVAHWLLDVQFVGSHNCPSPAQVERAFAAVRPQAEAANDVANEVVAIDPGRGGAAVVRFRSAGADPFAERTLPADMPCAERAKAAAVIVAAHL